MFMLIVMLLLGGGLFFSVSSLGSCASGLAEANILAKVAGENAAKAGALQGAVEVARAAEAEHRSRADATEIDARERVAAVERALREWQRQDAEAAPEIMECPITCTLPDLPQ